MGRCGPPDGGIMPGGSMLPPMGGYEPGCTGLSSVLGSKMPAGAGGCAKQALDMLR